MRCHFSFVVAFCILVSVVGCGSPTDPGGIKKATSTIDERVRGVTEQLDAIAEAIDQAAKTIPKESKEWRDHLLKLESNLRAHSADILANDLRSFADLTIGTGGNEVLFVVDVLESKIRGTLEQLRSAINTQRKRIRDTGRFEGTIDGLLKDLSAVLIPPEPMIAQISPNVMRVKYSNAYNETPARFEIEGEPKHITVNGYGFLRPTAEKKRFGLRITHDKLGPRTLDDESLISINTATAYQLTLNMQPILAYLNTAPETVEGDKRIELVWGTNDPISGLDQNGGKYAIGIIYGPKPLEPQRTRIPTITQLVVAIETTHDDKDKEIFFQLIAHLPQEQGEYATQHQLKIGPWGSTENVGNDGRVWPDSKGFKVDVPIICNPGIPIDHRARFMIRLQYHNNAGGNHGWEGRIVSVIGTLDDGNPIKLRGDTGDFKLGENGNPKFRDFPFTE